MAARIVIGAMAPILRSTERSLFKKEDGIMPQPIISLPNHRPKALPPIDDAVDGKTDQWTLGIIFWKLVPVLLVFAFFGALLAAGSWMQG